MLVLLAPEAFRKKTGIKVCTKHTGKMKGVWSLSISPFNVLCEKHSKCDGSICKYCYSREMQKMYADLQKCLQVNMDVLTKHILAEDEMLRIRNRLKMFRFESFGDIVSEIQVVNDFNIAKFNPEIKCAMWTKNPWIIQNAMKKYGISKPDNLIIIGSSYFINQPMVDFYKRYDFIDYIFTVYDKEYIKMHHIDINCGGRSCRDCKKCYLGNHDGYEIREKLK